MDTVGSSIRKECRENILSLLYNIQDLKWEGWWVGCNLILGIRIIWSLGWSVGASTCGLSVWLGFLPAWRTLGSQTVCGASGIQTQVSSENKVEAALPLLTLPQSQELMWLLFCNILLITKKKSKAHLDSREVYIDPHLSIEGASSLYHRKAGGMGIIV